MAGKVIHCLEKRVINLGSSAADQELILADRVELIEWQETTFLLRVHTHSLAAHNNQILIGAYPQSISEDDPAVDFLDVIQVIGTIDQNTTIPSFVYARNFTSSPPMARIVAMATRADSGTIAATISLDISVKDF